MTTNLPQARPPSRLATMLEARAPLDWATVLLRAPQLASAPRGDGRPVVLLPGYGSDEISRRPHGKYLDVLGYDVHEWGIGRNRGNVEAYVQRIGEFSGDIQRQSGNSVTLVGWSLGGVVARETARLFEPCIREVITMGTPIVGGPKYTAVAARFAEQSGIDLDAFELEVHERNLIGLRQPITAIYSKSDGVVGWRACIDVYNEHARNIQVRSSHFGMGASGRVWRLIADTLAADGD